MMKFEDVVITDIEQAYQNGRADMRKEIVQQLTELRSGTLGVMKALLTEMIDKVNQIK